MKHNLLGKTKKTDRDIILPHKIIEVVYMTKKQKDQNEILVYVLTEDNYELIITDSEYMDLVNSPYLAGTSNIRINKECECRVSISKNSGSSGPLGGGL